MMTVGIAPMQAKRYSHADGRFGPFGWLCDTDDTAIDMQHACSDFLFTFSSIVTVALSRLNGFDKTDRAYSLDATDDMVKA